MVEVLVAHCRRLLMDYSELVIMEPVIRAINTVDSGWQRLKAGCIWVPRSSLPPFLVSLV